MSFTFYFGAASGSARKALQMMNEPNVMISHATANNTPWYGIESLFIDSGGYSLMQSNDGEHGPIGPYVDYLRRHEPELYALRDYPCEPDLLDDLGRTVEDHQQRTTEEAIRTLESVGDIDSQPVTVIQGWTADDYLSHIDTLEDHGIPLDTVGIGSVCRRNAEGDIRSVIAAVRDRLPDAQIHAFGVKTSLFTAFPETVNMLDSADSLAYEYRTPQMNPDGKTWKDACVAYWKMNRSINEAVRQAQKKTHRTLKEFE